MWPKCSINNTFPYKMSILSKSNYGFKEGFNPPTPEAIYIAPQPYTLSSEGIHVRALTTLKWKNQ